MTKEIRVDLRIARTRSGLSNMDVAHLLGCGKDRVSKLEHGRARISTREIISLCLIYGRTVEQTFIMLSKDIYEDLKFKLSSLPESSDNRGSQHHLRRDTLTQLSNRLSVTNEYYEA